MWFAFPYKLNLKLSSTQNQFTFSNMKGFFFLGLILTKFEWLFLSELLHVDQQVNTKTDGAKTCFCQKNYRQRHTEPQFCDSGLNQKITRPCYMVMDQKSSTLLASSRVEYLASAMLWFRYRWKLCSGPCCMHSVFRVDPSICQQTTTLLHPVQVPTHTLYITTQWLFITKPKWRNNYALFKKNYSYIHSEAKFNLNSQRGGQKFKLGLNQGYFPKFFRQ